MQRPCPLQPVPRPDESRRGRCRSQGTYQLQAKPEVNTCWSDPGQASRPQTLTSGPRGSQRGRSEAQGAARRSRVRAASSSRRGVVAASSPPRSLPSSRGHRCASRLVVYKHRRAPPPPHLRHGPPAAPEPAGGYHFHPERGRKAQTCPPAAPAQFQNRRHQGLRQS